MRIPHLRRGAALAAVALASVVTGASAHEGNPDYRSQVRSIAPSVDGVIARVLDHDDALELTNRSGRTVVVYGYEDEPYARILANGAVQVDEGSATARALEEAEHEEAHDEAAAGYVLVSYDVAHGGEEHGDEEEHEDAHGDATEWRTLDRTGRFAWHDERIRWTEPGLPPQVTDEAKETKVRDWHVPIAVGGDRGAIAGTLLWVGEPGSDGGFQVAAAVSLGAVALVTLGAVALVRRRRRAEG